MNRKTSRRQFFGASTACARGLPPCPIPLAAAQSVGVKRNDLPDLTIKEVKVYVTDLGNVRRLNSTETGEIISIVTNSGHEGNYTIGNRSITAGWLEWAKPVLLGKNVIDLLPTITATSGLKASYGFGARRAGRLWRRARRPSGFLRRLRQPRRRHVAQLLHGRGRDRHVGPYWQGGQSSHL